MAQHGYLSIHTFSSELFERGYKSRALDSDRTYLYGRRLLNKSLLFPDVSERVGLGDVRNAIEYNELFSSFERLTDLQREIFAILKDVNASHAQNRDEVNRFLSFGEYSFKDYYEDAHEIVKTALESLENEEKAVKVLSIKDQKDPSGRGHAEPFVLKEKTEKICRFIDENKSCANLLLLLEGKISAMIGIATNIAEVGRNLHRPTEAANISGFFV